MAGKINYPIPQDPIGENFRWRDWLQKLSDRAYGTVAGQDSNDVDLTGGTIDGTIIGGTTPAAGYFTDLISNYLNTNYVQFNTTANPTIGLGKLRWNTTTGTLAFGIIDGTDEVNIGQQMFAYVTNAETVPITRGQAVYLYQAQGNRATVKLANNTGDATSAKTLGLVAQDSIAANATGFVITQGVLDKVNTGAFAEGDTLYLGATAGSLTSTKPVAPNHLVYIGVVERANAGNGQIYVRPQNGYELDEIHDVLISAPKLSGQTLIYDAVTNLWKNARLTAGTGISITNGAGSITIASTATGVTSFSAGTTGFTPTVATTGAVTLAGTLDVNNGGTGQTSYTNGQLLIGNTTGNTLTKSTLTQGTGITITNGNGSITIDNSAPDQTVSIANGTGINVTGTYPSFTVTNTAPDQTVALTAGTGINTSGTYPNFTITNSAPDQVVALSAGTGISTSGTYPNFTITNSAPDQTVTFTNGTGISVTGTYPAFTIDVVNGVYTTGSYADPSWITSLSGSKITGAVASATSATTATNLAGGTANQIPYQTGAGATSFITAPVSAGYLYWNGSNYIYQTPSGGGTVTSVDATGGTGISVTGGPITSSGTFTITNTAPDQVVSLTAGSNVTITGTYPSFTISATGGGGGGGTVTSVGLALPTEFTVSGSPVTTSGTLTGAWASQTANYVFAAPNGTSGTPTFRALVASDIPALSYVSSVGATAPIASSGGTTPTISISQATSTTDGYLSSTDWNTFNNKGNGTVTSVAALTLGTTGIDLSSTVANSTTTPVITLNVPTASATNRGALSSTDWSTFNGKQDLLVSGTNIKTVNGTTLLGSGDLGTIGIAYGGTGATSAPAAMTNLMGFTSTATSGGTTTLTNASSVYQVFTGTSAHTVQLPSTATLAQGWSYHIVNNSTNILTVNTSTSVLLDQVAPGATIMPTVLSTAGNTATDWEVGYTDLSVDARTVQQNIQAGNYTLNTTDIGKHIYHALGAAAAIYTIPANSAVPYEIGTALTFVNMATANVTIAITTDTMYLAGTGTTGSRTLAQYGVATALKLTATTWIISGSGLT